VGSGSSRRWPMLPLRVCVCGHLEICLVLGDCVYQGVVQGHDLAGWAAGGRSTGVTARGESLQ
jgi:hypothetical protein